MVGRKRIILSHDQEPAICAIGVSVKLARKEETAIQVGPRRDSASKGPIESAGGRAQQLLRTFVYAAEQHYNITIGPEHPLLTWLARHPGWVYTRFAVRQDGLTPYRRLKRKRLRRHHC